MGGTVALQSPSQIFMTRELQICSYNTVYYVFVSFQWIFLAALSSSVLNFVVCSGPTQRTACIWSSFLGFISRSIQIFILQTFKVSYIRDLYTFSL